MRVACSHGVLFALLSLAWVVAGCGEPAAPAPASAPAPQKSAPAGLGTLSVSGSGRESYSLRDAGGNHITSVLTGTDKEVAAGTYGVVLGNRAEVTVRAGETTRFATGVLAVAGTGKESWSLRDAGGNHVTSVLPGTEKDLVPGEYAVVLGNRAKVTVKGGEKTSLALGLLAVSGMRWESYSLRDSAGNHVTSVVSGTERELVPGEYSVVLGNGAKVTVKGGEKTSLALGVLGVSGTGKESWSLRDSAGNHVTSVVSNTQRELVPGEYSVVLGNGAKVTVKGGEVTSLALGVLVVGATGAGNFSLADEAGNHVTTIAGGVEKELVPGRYEVLIGEKKRAVEVAAGKTTILGP